MPIVNGAYEAPTWNNDAPPAINAAELQDICDTIETYNTSKADVSYVNTFVRPNLLDNAYFVGGGSQQGGGQFPINQRGQTTYVGKIIGIDRWNNNSSPITSKVTGSGLEVSISTGTSNNWFVVQYLENTRDISGKTVTLSALIIGAGANVNIRRVEGGSNVNSYSGYSTATGLNLVSVTTTLSNSASNAQVVIAGTTTSCTVVATKLEVGDTQTLAHWDEAAQEWVLNEVPNYEVELAKCQRYCIAVEDIVFGTNRYGVLGSGVPYNTSTMRADIPLPVTMRTRPTVSVIGDISTFRLQTGNETPVSISSIALDAMTTVNITLSVTASATLTAGKPYSLKTNSYSTGILLSADL